MKYKDAFQLLEPDDANTIEVLRLPNRRQNSSQYFKKNTIEQDEQPEEDFNAREQQDFIEVLYTNPHTGAQYKVKERKVCPPQGDFRINTREAKYASIMGLQSHRVERDLDMYESMSHPLESEPMVNERIILNKLSESVQQKAQLASRMRPNAEAPEDDTEIVAQDMKYNVVGPYGTEAKRQIQPIAYRPHAVRADVAQKAELHQASRQMFTQAAVEKPVSETKVSKQLESVLSQTFSALFLPSQANVSVQVDAIHDAIQYRSGPQTQVSKRTLNAHQFFQAGLCNRLEHKVDKVKQDKTVYEVGKRALQTMFVNQALKAEIMELQPEQIIELHKIVGTTIINSLLNNQKNPVASALDTKEKETLIQLVKQSINPSVYQGLLETPASAVPSQRLQEHSTDREHVSAVPIASEAHKTVDSREYASEFRHSAQVTRASIGSFSNLFRQRPETTYLREFQLESK